MPFYIDRIIPIYLEVIMAKTEDNKKWIRVEEHKRKNPGGERKTKTIREHCRSTPTKR